MTFTAVVVLSLIGVVEFLVGLSMFVVWQDMKYDMEWIKKGREQCFACQTGASVTSFDSRAKFCDHHLAHWVLITSLEKKTREELGQWGDRGRPTIWTWPCTTGRSQSVTT